MPFVPAAGTSGRVRIGVGNVAVAGVKEWRLSKQLGLIPVPHFEMPADSSGLVWSLFLAGFAQATCQINGFYDVSTNTEVGVGLKLGADIVLDLLFTKSPAFGYIDVTGFITQFNTGTNVDNQVGTFDATVQLTGVVPTAA